MDYISVDILCINEKVKTVCILNTAESFLKLAVFFISLLLDKRLEGLKVILLGFKVVKGINYLIDS